MRRRLSSSSRHIADLILTWLGAWSRKGRVALVFLAQTR